MATLWAIETSRQHGKQTGFVFYAILSFADSHWVWLKKPPKSLSSPISPTLLSSKHRQYLCYVIMRSLPWQKPIAYQQHGPQASRDSFIRNWRADQERQGSNRAYLPRRARTLCWPYFVSGKRQQTFGWVRCRTGWSRDDLHDYFFQIGAKLVCI